MGLGHVGLGLLTVAPFLPGVGEQLTKLIDEGKAKIYGELTPIDWDPLTESATVRNTRTGEEKIVPIDDEIARYMGAKNKADWIAKNDRITQRRRTKEQENEIKDMQRWRMELTGKLADNPLKIAGIKAESDERQTQMTVQGGITQVDRQSKALERSAETQADAQKFGYQSQAESAKYGYDVSRDIAAMNLKGLTYNTGINAGLRQQETASTHALRNRELDLQQHQADTQHRRETFYNTISSLARLAGGAF